MSKLFVETFDQDLDCNETINKTFDQDQDFRPGSGSNFSSCLRLTSPSYLDHILSASQSYLDYILDTSWSHLILNFKSFFKLKPPCLQLTAYYSGQAMKFALQTNEN